MRSATVRIRGLRLGLATATMVALASWWSLPWVRQQLVSSFQGNLPLGNSIQEATPLTVGVPESARPVAAATGLVRLFTPAQPTDPRERAIAQLDSAGLALNGESWVRAVATGHRPLINLYRQAGIDIDTPGAYGRSALLAAAVAKDWALVRELMAAGANINRADDHGLTPLMAAAKQDQSAIVGNLLEAGAKAEVVDENGHSALHYATATRSVGALAALLKTGVSCVGTCCTSRNLFSHALETKDWRIIEPILARQPAELEWHSVTRSLLNEAVLARDAAKTRALLSKHPASPTPEGRAQPMLAFALAAGDFQQFKFLLDNGANPNAQINSPVEKSFSQAIRTNFLKHYLDTEEGINLLMLASGLGRPEFVQALLEKGASRGAVTKKYKMAALTFATRNEDPSTLQMLIPGAPKPEQLRVEISIGAQRATVYKGGVPAVSTEVSTGRSGFATPTGEFVVTDKHRTHTSTLYDCPMPFFMRLSCRDFGMHQGVVPGYPASHGCIRVPSGMANKLFQQIPVGTLVSIRH